MQWICVHVPSERSPNAMLPGMLSKLCKQPCGTSAVTSCSTIKEWPLVAASSKEGFSPAGQWRCRCACTSRLWCWMIVWVTAVLFAGFSLSDIIMNVKGVASTYPLRIPGGIRGAISAVSILRFTNIFESSGAMPFSLKERHNDEHWTKASAAFGYAAQDHRAILDQGGNICMIG